MKATDEKVATKYKGMDIIALLKELQAKNRLEYELINKETAAAMAKAGAVVIEGAPKEQLIGVLDKVNAVLAEVQKNPSAERVAIHREITDLLNIAIPRVKEREARLLQKTRGKAQLLGIIDLYGLEVFNPADAWHQLKKLSLEAEGITLLSISGGTAWAYATPEMRELVKSKQAAIAEEIKKQETYKIARAWTLTADGYASQALTSPDFRITPETHLTISRARTIDIGKIKITQEDCNILLRAGISTQALMIYDSITAAAKNGGPYVIFTVKEYMERRGIKDEKAAREQILNAFDEIGKISYRFPHSKNPNLRINIREASDIENGRAHFQLTPSFFSYISRDKLLPMPAGAYRININKNPNTYYIIKRIQQHRSWYLGRSNESVIGIPTLLEGCPKLPSPEEVLKKSKQLTQLIARPFMRDLEAAKKDFYLELRGAKGKPAPDPQAGGGWQSYTYEEIQGLYVYSVPLNPEHPAQKELRAKRQLSPTISEDTEAIEDTQVSI